MSLLSPDGHQNTTVENVSLLHCAALVGNTSTARYLLNAGVNPAAVMSNGMPPVLVAFCSWLRTWNPMHVTPMAIRTISRDCNYPGFIYALFDHGVQYSQLEDFLEEKRDVLERYAIMLTQNFMVPMKDGSMMHLEDLLEGLCTNTAWSLLDQHLFVQEYENYCNMRVLFIGRLLETGHVDFSRLVAVTGSEVTKPHYVRTCAGASIASITRGLVKKADYEQRYISGNVLTGFNAGADGYLGARQAQVTVIPEGNNCNEFMGWASLNPHKYSTSHSYFSWLLGKKRRYAIDARVRGGERAIIMSDEYDRVFPMDIYPEYLIKAILAFDIDKMENLGIYEVAPEDFALCEFVDTSKLELQKIVRNGLDRLMKEMN